MGDISSMGVDIEVYRDRLGLNDLKMKRKFKTGKHQPYKGYNNGTYIHLRCCLGVFYAGLFWTYLYNSYDTSLYRKQLRH